MTAFSAVVASLNNIGPGLHQVGPATNFAVLSDFQTWVCAFAMLLGPAGAFCLAGDFHADILAKITVRP